MQKGEGTSEVREIVRAEYLASAGRDIAGLLVRLKKERGIDISVRTLYNWKREGGWDLDAGCDSRAPMEEKAMQSLNRLMGKLNKRIEESEAIDPQVVYAYLSAIKTAASLSANFPLPRDPDEDRRIANAILRKDEE